MILETTLLIDRWLHHDIYGVEQMLITVPRKNPEGTAFDLPKTPHILNDFEDDDVATELDPDKAPALVVFVDTDSRVGKVEQDRQISATPLVVSVAYITRDVPPSVGQRDGAFVLRAVKKSLTNYNSSTKAEGYRTLNGIMIAEIKGISERRVIAGLGASEMFGFVFARVNVIDSEPT